MPGPNNAGSPTQQTAFTLPSMTGLDPMAASSFQQQTNPMSGGGGGTEPGGGGGGVSDPLSMLNPTTSSSGPSSSTMAPKFPPQNFEVPDISFSNSVSAMVDFDPSFFPPSTRYHNTTVTSAGSTKPTSTSYAGFGNNQEGLVSSMTPGGGRGGGSVMAAPSGGQRVTTVSASPPGSSSSEDSDDLPLAQIASMKRTAVIVINSSSSTETAMGSSADTASMDSSPVPGKKAKTSKRKKKKDPNEPTKPVSAYALFFRDTQATIKNHNPSASFGEVSKIVASMWDQLDPEHKDVYKKKTEMAKKLYLKQLAAYRASQVSQSTAEEMEKSPSPPGMSVAPPNMVSNPGLVHSSGGQAVLSPSHMSGQMMHMPQQMMPQQQQQQFFHHQDPLLQQHHHQQQQQQQQLQQMQHDQQTHVSGLPPTYSTPQDHHQHHHHHMQQQQHSPPQHLHHQQPTATRPSAGSYHSPPHTNPAFSSVPADQANMMGFQNNNLEREVNYTPCTRNGCINQAQENPAWDSEFCSHDCVITHCRDIFTNWATARSSTNAFPVK